jgi:hypothetical protein
MQAAVHPPSNTTKTPPTFPSVSGVAPPALMTTVYSTKFMSTSSFLQGLA